MNDVPDDMPDIQYKPSSIVTQMGGEHAVWIVESPQEIREKLKAMRDDHGLGLEDAEPLLVLTGLNVWGGEKVTVEPYEQDFHPSTVIGIKEVTEEYWNGQLTLLEAGENPDRGAGRNPLGEALSAMGFQMVGPDSNAFMTPGSEFMSLGQFNDGGAETECCCGHEAHAHEIGDEKVGKCTSCDCPVFHTHSKEQADEDQSQD